MSRIRKTVALCLWACCAAVLLMGCNGDIKDYCEKYANCEGGNENDQKACEAETEGERDAAKEYDCKDQFDDMLSCEVDNGVCDPDYGYGAGSECDAAWSAYGTCIVANSSMYTYD